MDAQTDVGPLATASGRDELEELVDDALANGAAATVRRQLPERADGWFYPPTVLTGVTPAMRIHHEEAFGPSRPSTGAEDADEALRIANDTTFGLSSSVWTTRRRGGGAVRARPSRPGRCSSTA